AQRNSDTHTGLQLVTELIGDSVVVWPVGSIAEYDACDCHVIFDRQFPGRRRRFK
ncbi:unnamed protein product, partial [marine sediment metagenome]